MSWFFLSPRRGAPLAVAIDGDGCLLAHSGLQGLPPPSALPTPTYPDVPHHLRPTPTPLLGHRCRLLAGVLQASRKAPDRSRRARAALALTCVRAARAQVQLCRRPRRARPRQVQPPPTLAAA